ncbi:hypothetical protein GCM10027419_52460 [Pandoraea terrae]
MVGAAIAVAVVGMLITFWGAQQARHMRIEKGAVVGEALKVLGRHVQGFVVQHHGDIKKLFLSNPGTRISMGGLEMSAKTTDLGKTIAGLTAESVIRVMGAKGIGASPPLAGAQYQIYVYSDNCADDNSKCDINSVTYLSAPIRSTYAAEPDFVASGVAVKKIGALGGISHKDEKNGVYFRFRDGNGIVPIKVPSPDPEVGLIAVRGGNQISVQDVFMRRDGTRPMLGNLNMEERKGKHHNIAGAGDITGIGTLSMKQLSASQRVIAGYTGDDSVPPKYGSASIVAKGLIAGRDIKVEERLTTKNLTVTGTVKKTLTTESINAEGTIHAKKGPGTSAGGNLEADGNIKADGNISSRGTVTIGSGQLHMGKQFSPGSWCTGHSIGLSFEGLLMACQNNQWRVAEGQRGETGERGAQGARGERGAPGEKGDRGDRGPMGPRAEVKVARTYTWYRNDCNPGSAGEVYNLGRWDYCDTVQSMRACALPNQDRRVWREDNGEWTFRIKQVSGVAYCQNFEYEIE